MRVNLAPEAAFGKAEADARDIGLLIRATPLNRLDPPHGARAASGLPPRIDLSYGWSVLNYNDALFVFVDERQANPASRIHRNGVAGRSVLGPTESLQEMLGHRDWLMRSLSPLISVGFANDWEHITAGDAGPGYNVQRYGGELSVVNVLHLRFGHVTDKLAVAMGRKRGPRGPHILHPTSRSRHARRVLGACPLVMERAS